MTPPGNLLPRITKFWLTMRITTFLLMLFLVQASASGLAQKVTLFKQNSPLADVFKDIRQQSGYDFVFTTSTLKNAKPVTIKVKDADLKQVLELIFSGQPLTYTLGEKSVVVKRKTSAMPANKNNVTQITINLTSDYGDVRGMVVDESGSPLAGASIGVITFDGKRTAIQTKSDRNGAFILHNVPKDANLSISFVGYATKAIPAKANVGPIILKLMSREMETLEVVVSTGYQTLPKERATGSFSQIDNKVLNYQVGTNIMDRLEAIGNGIVMDRTNGNKPQLMVRGLSTINGPRDVLIIVDNFPYEGDINNINPNDVEQITILKDAAAASIWGARAGNGVIVITTKGGKYNQPVTVSLNSNVTVGGKPDLYKVPQLSSSGFIDFEHFLFDKGYYNSKLNANPFNAALSPVVELLRQRKTANPQEIAEIDKQIDAYRSLDIRDDMTKHLYRNSVNQQYALSAYGGSPNYNWNASAGYDNNLSTLGGTMNRTNLNFKNTFKLSKQLELTSNIYFTQVNNKSGALGYGELTQGGGLYPYTRIADDFGNEVGIDKEYRSEWTNLVSQGKMMDWKYYPLSDHKYDRSNSKRQDVLLNTGLKYQIIPGLALDLKYQYEHQTTDNATTNGLNSYQMRRTINMHTIISPNGGVNYGYPYGARYQFNNQNREAHQFRSQLNLNKIWGDHEVIAIAGAEVRTLENRSQGGGMYGYNEDLLTFTQINSPKYINIPNILGWTTTLSDLTNPLTRINTNFISFFGNAAYSYLSKYTLSVSARNDASNLFGIRTNDQWNPFFSTGFAWNLSKEDFYPFAWLPQLKLRTTYGISGNIDPAMVASSTIAYGIDNNPFTNTNYAQFNKYKNVDLKWETSKQFNLGLDFATASNRVSGSVEYFHKKGTDLFGTALLDYTGGAGTSIIKNIAGMKGSGVDFDLNVRFMDERDFRWSGKFNFSIYKDELTDYYLSSSQGSSYIATAGFGQGTAFKPGYPVNGVYSYKWAGLDPTNGDPRGYVNGEISNNYSAIHTGTKADDLVFHGSAIPTHFGSIYNNFAYKDFEFVIALSFKFNYFFRRETVNFQDIAGKGFGNKDFDKRWQKPGDELHTDIPSVAYPFNFYRTSMFYQKAEPFVEKGDHIRLQFMQLNYLLRKENLRWLPFKQVRVYGNANNLGLIWKANKEGIDPDFIMKTQSFGTPSTASYSFGLQVLLNN